MGHIKSRKHPARTRANHSVAVALAVMSMPALAQQTDVLPEVNVAGQAETYKAETISSPKFTQPLVDTPQTISVIKKEILQEQGARTLLEALRNTPGITMLLGEGGNSNTKDNIFMRGFDTSGSIFIDGVRDLGNFPRDIYNTEQVEVIKGPSGSEYGRGAPSGTINIATKVPLLGDINSASVAAGTDKQKRATVDLNRQLSETSAFRLNAMVQNSGVPGRDHVKNKGFALAPSLAFGLNTPTRTFLAYEHVDQDNRPDGGVPTIGLSGSANAAAPRANRNNYYGVMSDFEKVNGDMFTARVEHDFAPGLTLRNTTRIAKVKHQLLLTAPNATAARSRHAKWQENELVTNQTNLTAEFQTGALQHTLSTGLELIREKQLSRTLTGAGVMPAADIYNPNPHDAFTTPVNLQFTGAQVQGETSTVALYAFDTIKINDQWQVNGGLRLDRYNTDNDTLAGTPLAPAHLSDSDTLLTWKLGALYKPAPNGSIYASYSTSQQPPGGSNFTYSATAGNINDPNMDPQKATNIELGTKWDVLDNKLGLTAALFRSENKNDLTTQGADPGEFVQYGKRRVQGIELGLVGNITKAWSVSAALAKMSSKISEGNGPAQTGARLNWSPELTFSAWTSYRLPFGLILGGGARYVDSMVRSATNTPAANMPSVPSYWVFDAMAAYEVNKNLSLQLNLYNLANKFYIANMNNNGNRYTPGGERAALLTANLKF